MICLGLNFISQAQVQVVGSRWLYALDTTTNAADTNTTTGIIVSGFKFFSVSTTIKAISGTSAGTTKLYGSVDGTNYTVFALDSAVIDDRDWTYVLKVPINYYQKAKLVVMLTTGTHVTSTRSYILGKQ